MIKTLCKWFVNLYRVFYLLFVWHWLTFLQYFFIPFCHFSGSFLPKEGGGVH